MFCPPLEQFLNEGLTGTVPQFHPDSKVLLSHYRYVPSTSSSSGKSEYPTVSGPEERRTMFRQKLHTDQQSTSINTDT